MSVLLLSLDILFYGKSHYSTHASLHTALVNVSDAYKCTIAHITTLDACTHLLRLAGKSLWSTAAAGRPPGPNMPPSAFPKSSLTEAEGDVPRPRILGEDPAAGGVLEQSCAASTTSAMRCLCLLASRRSSYATLSSCIMTDMGPLLVLL